MYGTIYCAIIGLCLGSFVNAFVWRLHSGRDWVKDRSMCPRCKHTLSALDLIPVLSWLVLRGRCRYCHKSISIQYPIVELLGSFIFAASYRYWPVELHTTVSYALFGGWLILSTGLLALAVYDLKWQILPNKVIYPAIIFAIALVLLEALPGGRGASAVREAVLGIAGLGGIFYLLYTISDGRWIGGGDVKLGVLLGLIVGGLESALLTLFVASLLGTVLALPLMALGKMNRRSKVPFGPFLIVAAFVAKLFGASIIVWYRQTFLRY